MSALDWFVTAVLAVAAVGIFVWGLMFLNEMTYEQERTDSWEASDD